MERAAFENTGVDLTPTLTALRKQIAAEIRENNLQNDPEIMQEAKSLGIKI